MAESNTTGFRGWEKWALISVLILGLSSIVVYFNVKVFAWDGWPYVAVVSFIVLLSFIVTSHIKRKKVTSNFLLAAFIFEILLVAVLGINVAYSLSVMREMSVAGQGEASQRETIKEIGKLKGGKTQRDALKIAGTTAIKTRQTVFAENEQVLFWIMIAELGVAVLAMFTLLGLSVFDKNLNGVPDFLESEEITQTEIDLPKA